GADPGRQQDECRTDALAAGGKEVGHRSRDHIGVRGDQRPQAELDGGEVGGDWSKEIGRVLYVVCVSQSWTSCARTPSPKMLAATSSNCCGIAVTNIS